MKFKKILIIMLVLGTIASCKQEKETGKIRALISQTFNRSDSKVTVDTIVVVGNYALNNWKQGKMAGRTLFKKQNGKWAFWLCGGKGLKDETGLTQAGVPADTARLLVRKLSSAEVSLSKEDIQRFDDFGPTVDMSNMNSHHPHN